MRVEVKVTRLDIRSLTNYITVLAKQQSIKDHIYVKFHLTRSDPIIKFVAYGQNVEYGFVLGVKEVLFSDVNEEQIYKFNIEDFLSPYLAKGWREVDLIWDCDNGKLTITKNKG